MKKDNLPALGAFIEAEGGHFGGLVRVNQILCAAIWAPKDAGETEMVWHPKFTDIISATSYNDSLANTVAMAEDGSPLAQWATGLRIAGFSDWAIPARDVLELAYRHLKPTTYQTGGYFRDGDNPSSEPPGYPYAHNPVVQTSAQDFQEGGPQAFEEALYWSSTQYSSLNAWFQYFSHGYQSDDDKSSELRARVVRTIQLID